ncbi:MAG: hypothetical protein LBV41_05290 [Cytophagaceae bacterium]|nr:hypothetical protein [Cytophagaceae bacterium]
MLQIYNAIKGDYYRERTQKLWAISDVGQARKFKAANFDYCTFSGIFTIRNDKALIKHSGLLCVDFDHLNSIETLFNRLLKDEYFDTQLLFCSPSGDGLKWIISIDTADTTHGDYFTSVANYISQTYGIAVDKSGQDISRACFLPHDSQAFINPIYLKYQRKQSEYAMTKDNFRLHSEKEMNFLFRVQPKITQVKPIWNARKSRL